MKFLTLVVGMIVVMTLTVDVEDGLTTVLLVWLNTVTTEWKETNRPSIM